MSETSANLELPYLQAAQAQKHVTHNAALEILDLTAQLSVQAFGATTPPLSPTEGHVWAIGAGASGDWAGHGGELAGWSNGGWVFITPRPGWRAAQGIDLRLWDGSAWVAPSVVPTLQNLPGVGINTTSDLTNRLAVASEAVLFSHAGAGHQVKVNKAAAGDTASLLFQTGWSGRAEMGLAGDDDFSLKVSPDGSSWSTALQVNRTSGVVSLANGLGVAGALTLPAGGVVRAALANGAALSVMGRSANSAGAVADIAAGSDHQVLRRSGSAIGFGALALNQPNAVTGVLGLANGGTGAGTAAGARTALGLVAGAQGLRATSGGTANAVTLTSGAGISGTPPTGLQLRFRASAANTGATTIALDGGSPIACRTVTGVALPAGYVRTDADTVATFDGTFWVLNRAEERGSNANGTFVRFETGLMLCWARLTMTQNGSDTHRMTASWTYPAAYVSAPNIAANLPLVNQDQFSSITGTAGGRISARGTGPGNGTTTATDTQITAFFDAGTISETSQITNVHAQTTGPWY